MLGSECLHDYPLVKILGTLYCTSLVDGISHGLSKLVGGAIEHVLCDFTGRRVFEFAPGFLICLSSLLILPFILSVVNPVAPKNNYMPSYKSYEFP